MSLPFRRTNRAEADVDEIWLWIAQDNIDAAEELTDRLEAAENRLGRYPEIGQARPDLAARVRH
jgi:toxin ParE1/3/4